MQNSDALGIDRSIRFKYSGIWNAVAEGRQETSFCPGAFEGPASSALTLPKHRASYLTNELKGSADTNSRLLYLKSSCVTRQRLSALTKNLR